MDGKDRVNEYAVFGRVRIAVVVEFDFVRDVKDRISVS